MFENVIFAGGGSRCVWQLGFWHGANSAGLGLDETVSYVASTSAGCAMATAAILNREQEALDRFKALTAANPSNIHWQNLRPGSRSPLLPHTSPMRGMRRMYKSSSPWCWPHPVCRPCCQARPIEVSRSWMAE